MVNLADSNDTFILKSQLATHSIRTECEVRGMIATIEILPSLTEFDHFKMDEVALLQLLKQLIQVRLVFNPGGKVRSPLLFRKSKCALQLLYLEDKVAFKAGGL